MKKTKLFDKLSIILSKIFNKDSDVKLLNEKNDITAEKIPIYKAFSMDVLKTSLPKTYEEFIAQLKTGKLNLEELEYEDLLNIEKICIETLNKKEEKVKRMMEEYRKNKAKA